MITVDDVKNFDIPFSTVGYLTYKRTYARKIFNIGITEEFPETMVRVINSFNEQLGCGFSRDEEDRLIEYFCKFKGSVAGRFLWQLGTDTVTRFGLASLQNCAFTVVDSPIRPFCWAMDMLCLGSGVGYNLQREHVYKIPEVKEWFKAPTRFDDGGADFIVPDSREGWVRLLGKTLKAAFLSEDPSKGTFTYSTQIIRGKGSPIKGFGGVASGPEDLVWGIGEISKVLTRRAGKKLRPIDALDIMNIIGYVVVAGNVRRSAQIAIGDPDDIEFLLAKRWDLGVLPKWRSMSNNSVVCNDISDLHEYFWDGYEGKGEPYGLINLNLSRKVGRLGDYDYPDFNVMGYNPCGEQSLEPYETCCLAEIYLPNIDSKEELFDVCELLYRICKHSLLLPSHHKETADIVHKNMRMGIGVTGIQQASTKQIEWLDEGYEYLRAFDCEYSDKLGIPRSIKLTTIKPSGTLSLLPGVTPGIHPGFAAFMKRRITISADHPLVEICKDHGYEIEYRLNLDGSYDRGSVVVTFPYAYPKGTRLAKDMSAIDQLEDIRLLQRLWSDNSVSCSVYYKKEELPQIREYLARNYKNSHKSLSFMLHSESGFLQPPFEEITEEEYNELCSKTRIIKSIVREIDYESQDECTNGACPIR